ncbi:lysozyme [Aestuariivirga sp.]|uniref:lysozyme n=1 Tax=Aestuariivirga sp. TaxID=2650926 RepID=UPI0025BC7CE6|nr:lysozyme [Aestuariivirga sp.]MCA3555315.1 lysozyme [Aestuariivirga sp.]
MQVTDEGLALIRRFEGFRANAYRCPAGVWTIGYGHTSQAGPPAVKPGMQLGEEEADRILKDDVRRFADEVGALLAREVSGAQFSALVSFAYNVGIPAFRSSSVLRAVNAGRFHDVPARLRLWVKGGGRVLPGLERRRAAEAELFMSETAPQAGRGATGAPKSVETGRQLRHAGAVVGGTAVAVSAAHALPVWVSVAVLVVLVLAAGAYASWRWRRPAAGKVA